MSSKGIMQIKKGEGDQDRGVFEDAYTGLQQRMGRMFEKLMDMTLERQSRLTSFIPRVDLVETDGQIKVSAELPGLTQKDVEVTVSQDNLVIKGEKKIESETEEKGVSHIERSYGSFFRRIDLPSEVEVENVDAVFAKGVLTITLQKSESQKSRKVELKGQ